MPPAKPNNSSRSRSLLRSPGLVRRLIHGIAAFCAALALHGQNAIFTEGFEGAFPGANWFVGDANPLGVPAYWGAVDAAFGGAGTAAGDFKGYCAGVGFAGTVNVPAYLNFMTAFMERTVNLAGYPRARLMFQHRMPSIESCCDSARVLVDGATVWTQNTPQPDWAPAAVDLDIFLGGNHTLRFEFDSDLSENFAGWYLDEIKLAIPPVNDHFTNATVISGAAGVTNGTTILSSLETNEPSGFPAIGVTGSVWYRWTAPSSNCFAFSVPRAGTNDAVIHVFTGSTLSNLVDLGGEYGTPATAATAAFLARAGSNYLIRVAGFPGGNSVPEANFQLSWQPATNATQRLFAARAGTNIVVSWFALTHRLQSATNFLPGAVWSDVAGTTPVTLPFTRTNRFFRLICP